MLSSVVDLSVSPAPPQTLNQGVAPGAALGLAAVVAEKVRTNRAKSIRVRVSLALTTASLQVKFWRPDGSAAYAQGQPAAVALAVGETSTDIPTGGEAIAEIQLTQTGATPGSVNWVDVSQSA